MNDIKQYILTSLKNKGADMAQCSLAISEKDELNAEQNEFSLMRTTFSTSVSIKVVKNQRKGVISLNKTDQTSLDTAIDEVLSMTENSAPDEAEGIAELIDNHLIKSVTNKLDREKMYDRLNEFLNHVKIHYPKVNLEQAVLAFNKNNYTYANTNGVELSNTTTFYSYSSMFNAQENGVASSFNGAEFYSAALEKPILESAMVKMLISESEQQISPIPFKGKIIGDMIVTPACLGDILNAYVSNFLSDMPLIQKTSILQNSLNQKVSSALFTLRSLPISGGLCAVSSISDGYVSKDTTIIEKGVLKEFVLSRYGAKRTGGKRAGNLFSAPVVDPGDVSLDEMIKNVKNGIIMNRFSGGSPASNGDFSGIAKNSFLIKDGRIAGALSETMISANLLEMFRNINAISTQRIHSGCSIFPYLSFRNITISGK